MKRTIGLFTIVCCLWGIQSCSQGPGDGGLATITGKVYGYQVYPGTNPLILKDSGYVGNERVYLSYGDNTTIDDDVRTSYTGEYKFQWLREGDYKVWVFSYCDTCPLKQTVSMKNVSITEKRQTVHVPDLIQYF